MHIIGSRDDKGICTLQEMRIMFLTRSLNYGGAERQLAVLSTGLKRRGHDVCVAVFYANGPLQEDLERAGICVHVLNKLHRWDLVGFIVRLYRVIRDQDPDILHGYLYASNVLLVFLKLFVKRPKIIWGVRTSKMDMSQYDWTARMIVSISSVVARYADHIIVNSISGMKFHISKGYPASKTEFIANGIDTNTYQSDMFLREKIRKEWNIGKGVTVIGMVARLDPMKNYETFIDAALLMARQRQDVCFVSIGEGSGPYSDKLHAQGATLESEGRLIWIGARKDMPAVYSAFDILTNSSIAEGFPNVVAEAMSCGLPCVVTDVGDSASILGKHGVVVPPRDPVKLKDAWDQLIVDGSRDRSTDTRKRIIDNYSVEKMVLRTESALAAQLL